MKITVNCKDFTTNILGFCNTLGGEYKGYQTAFGKTMLFYNFDSLPMSKRSVIRAIAAFMCTLGYEGNITDETSYAVITQEIEQNDWDVFDEEETVKVEILNDCARI